MRVFFHNDNDIRLNELSVIGLENLYLKMVSNEGFKLGTLHIFFHTNESLLEINKTFLNHDYFTDIITFDYTRGDKISGELHISLDFIENFAGNHDIPFGHELYRILIHGALHLLGYKDSTSEEQKEMRNREDFYLSFV